MYLCILYHSAVKGTTFLLPFYPVTALTEFLEKEKKYHLDFVHEFWDLCSIFFYEQAEECKYF